MDPRFDGDPNPLITLFRQCVVRVTDEAGRFLGSGFFVAPGRMATCGHVIHGAAGLRVWWQEQVAAVSRAATVPPLVQVADPGSYPLPDLAVLGAGEAAGWGHPCAALTVQQPVLGEARDGLYLAGYTIEHGPVPALTGATTGFESLVTEDGHTFYKLKRGLLLPGFSGSPLLDLRTGLVAGITESSRGRHADLGGFAVPAAELAAAFPDLLEANRAFHHDDHRWEDATEAEKARAEERNGGRARLPLRPPVVGLTLDEDLSPAKILRPAAGAVPGSVHGFPAALMSFIGRAGTVREVAGCLEQSRLVTVTGPGGVGKTRVALEVARQVASRFADGVWLVELAKVEDQGQVLAVAASTLGVREQHGVPLAQALARALARQQLLVVLDNCEHIVGEAAHLCVELLSACGDVKILATSREPLAVAGELHYRLAPLTLPSSGGPAEESEAVALFAERARRADMRFTLDGRPLRQWCDCGRLQFRLPGGWRTVD